MQQRPIAEQRATADFLGRGYSRGDRGAEDDVPWVIGTRLAPGEKLKRGFLWAIVCGVLALLHLIAAVVGYGSVFSMNGDAFILLLPFWGILSLLLLASIIVCLVRRGGWNIAAAVSGAFVLVFTNPVLPLLFI